MKINNQTMGWGKSDVNGYEFWDAPPLFVNQTITRKDKLKLFFYPKKFLLYRYIDKHRHEERYSTSLREPFRILDVGCGTGGVVIDLKRLYGRSVEVVGLDVIRFQTEIAEMNIKKYGLWAPIDWYDGTIFPYDNNSFDAVHTSDVLGHVEDVDLWLSEICRVLKPGGVLAMFSESRIGKHALIRRRLEKKGINLDPHTEFHISLFSKTELREKIEMAGFEIKSMYSSFLAKFFVHPDEVYPVLQAQEGVRFWRWLNRLLYRIKRKFHPYSTALAELYGLIEMVTIGRFVESQGYIILARKPGGRE
jgi:ubiquinone/menaquinone biosynthesis C-methylase UbiE